MAAAYESREVWIWDLNSSTKVIGSPSGGGRLKSQRAHVVLQRRQIGRKRDGHCRERPRNGRACLHTLHRLSKIDRIRLDFEAIASVFIGTDVLIGGDDNTLECVLCATDATGAAANA